MKKKFINPEMEILLFDEIEMIMTSGVKQSSKARLGGVDTSLDMAEDALGRKGVSDANVTVVEANSIN
jgi:hypothetical protein